MEDWEGDENEEFDNDYGEWFFNPADLVDARTAIEESIEDVTLGIAKYIEQEVMTMDETAALKDLQLDLDDLKKALIEIETEQSRLN